MQPPVARVTRSRGAGWPRTPPQRSPPPPAPSGAGGRRGTPWPSATPPPGPGWRCPRPPPRRPRSRCGRRGRRERAPSAFAHKPTRTGQRSLLPRGAWSPSAALSTSGPGAATGACARCASYRKGKEFPTNASPQP